MHYPKCQDKTAEFGNECYVYCNAANSDGYIIAEYAGDQKYLAKTEMKKGDDKYVFDMYGRPEVLPFVYGDGEYEIRVLRQTDDPAKYLQLLKMSLSVKMSPPWIRFKYPNQRVWYTPSSKAAAKAAELCRGKTSETGRFNAIYDFIVNNFTYDTQLASAVQPRYLPDCDRTLARKMGICCDIAALFACMCRSQGLLCKYVTGYVLPPGSKDKLYHAYNYVYCNDNTVLFGGLAVKQNTWTLLDLTFSATNMSSQAVIRFVSNNANYDNKNAY